MMLIKDKLVRNIILSVLGLGILGGAYYLVLKMPEKTEEMTQEQTSPENRTDTSVIAFDIKELEKAYIKNENDEYTIIKNGENWAVEGRNTEYSKVKTENLLYSFANFYVTKQLENGDKEEYGLANPSAKVVLTKKDGTEHKIILGSQIIGDDGYFAEIDDKIYTVSTSRATNMQKTANDLRDTVLATVDKQTFKGFKLRNREGIVANIRPMNEEESDKFSMLTSYMMTEPKYVAVSMEYTNKIIDSALNVTAEKFVCDDRAKFGEYGLANPVITFEISDETGSYVINYGNKTDDGNVYANIGGTDTVFIQRPEMFDTLVKIDTLTLIEKYCHIINIESIRGVTIEGEGKKFSLTLEGEADNRKYFSDGKTANEKAFKRAYQEVIGLISNGFAEKVVSGNPEYIIEFDYKDGTKLRCSYINYDERNFVLDRNGNREYIILKKNLTTMISKLEEFAKSPEKEPK